MHQFVYRIQPTRLAILTEGPTPEETTIIGEHFNYLAKLAEEGVVLMAGRTLNADETTFRITILVAPSEAEARVIMNEDPAIKCGMMKCELFPFRVAVWSAKGPGGN